VFAALKMPISRPINVIVREFSVAD